MAAVTRKRIGILVISCGFLFAQFMSISGAGAVSGPGSLAVGHPGTITRGITETEFRNVKVCASMPASQGVDAWIVDLNGATGTFTAQGGLSAVPFSLNLYFVNAACLSIGFYFAQGTSVSKPIPATAEYAVISAVYGANISLTYSY